MAYLYQQKEEDDPNKKQEQAQTGEQPGGGQNLVTSGGSSSLVGAGSSSGSPDTGSGWTNLQDYVGANEGESERGAQRIVDDVSQQRADTTQAVTQFGESDVRGFDQADDTFLDDLRSGRTGQGEQVSNLYGADYRGPENTQAVAGYDETLGQVQDFQRTSDALDDPYRITEEYNPGGNIGEKNLDRFFYQQKPAQDIFQREVQAGDAVDDLWAQNQAGLTDKIDADRAAYGQQQSDIKGAFDQGLASLQGQLNPVYTQKYVDDENARRRSEFDSFMKGDHNRSGRVGDFESKFGDQIGYDWNKMFDYSGDTKMGDYVNLDNVGNYRNFVGEYGDAFGAQDQFAGADLGVTGARDWNPVGTGDIGQKQALSEFGNLYNKGPDRSADQNRWNELINILGIQGYSDPRPLPPPAPLPPAPTGPEITPNPDFSPSRGADPEEDLLEIVLGPDYKKKASDLFGY